MRPKSAPYCTVEAAAIAPLQALAYPSADDLPAARAALAGPSLAAPGGRSIAAVLAVGLGSAVLGTVGLAVLVAGAPAQWPTAFVLLLAAAALALAIGWAMRRALAAPVRRLTRSAEELALRHGGQPVASAGSELDVLARACSALTEVLLAQAERRQRAHLEELQNALELQRQYALMRLLRGLAASASESDSVEQALERAVDEIGQYLDWPIGRAAVLDDGDDPARRRLRRSIWFVRDRARHEAFIAASESRVPGSRPTGLAGRACASGLPQWVSDLDLLADFGRRQEAAACGLKSAVVIPVVARGHVMALVEFFADHRVQASAEMIELVEAIAVELSRVAERHRAERELRASKDFFRVLFDSSPVAAALERADGRLMRVNDACARLFGVGREALIGVDLVERVHPDERAAAAARRAAPDRPATDTCECRLLRGDGRELRARVHAAEMTRGEAQPLRLLVLEDLTDLRAREDRLREAKEAAEAASRAKSQFLANMSHEIRTPMNGVLGMTELLLGTGLSQQQRRFAQAVYRSGESLLAIINDILDLSKIEAGRLELDCCDFDLRTLVGDVLELQAARAADKRVELSCRIAPAVPAIVHGDPLRVRQVLTNLVGNAIKFTERGQVLVRVDAEADAEFGTPAGAGARATVRLRFEVSDTGIGIRAEVLERLFAPFMQADQSMSRRYGGTGLGLAISRQLVELMGGRIEVESEAGRGSVFRFDLRVRSGGSAPSAQAIGAGAAAEVADGAEPWPQAEGPAGAPAEVAQAAAARVLLVEDNAVNQEVARAMLEDLGARVQVAGDGRVALELLAHQVFDLILMDCQMPELDGFETLRRLRDPALTPHLPAAARSVPVVALTANALAGDEARCRAAGFDDYLAKPVRQGQLAQIVQRHDRATGAHAAGHEPASASRTAPAPTDAAGQAGAPDQGGTQPAELDAQMLASIADLERCGAPRLLQRLIDTYVDSAARLMAGGAAALAVGDTAALRQAMHTLKSSSASLGGAALAGRCAAIEAAARAGDLAAARAQWAAVAGEYQRTLAALQRLQVAPDACPRQRPGGAAAADEGVPSVGAEGRRAGAQR